MDNIVTKREAAEILAVHPSTVQRMVSDGVLRPHRTIDGPSRISQYLFRRVDVERIARQRAKAAA